MDRPTKDEYFMAFAVLAGERSVCLRHKIGADIVVDGQIVSTGYNGPPGGVPHCRLPIASNDVVCVRERDNTPSGTMIEHCHGLHAEQNAIVQAARHGIAIKDSIMYCNFKPCITCIKMIINAGIKEVVYQQDYDDEATTLMALAGDIELRKFDLDI